MASSDHERRLWIAVFYDDRFLHGPVSEDAMLFCTRGQYQLKVKFVADDEFRSHAEACVSQVLLGSGDQFQRLKSGQDNLVGEFHILVFDNEAEALASRNPK